MAVRHDYCDPMRRRVMQRKGPLGVLNLRIGPRRGAGVVKQRILSYHMTPVTQAIQSSLIIVQTNAECCLEVTHMGYRMFHRLVWVRARLGATSANTQSLSSLSPSPSSIVLSHSGLLDQLSSNPPLCTSSHAVAGSSSQSDISFNPTSYNTSSRATLSSLTRGNAADAPYWHIRGGGGYSMCATMERAVVG